MAKKSICTIPNCDKPHYARGLCGTHYQRWRIHGDPLFLKQAATGEPERYFREVVMAYEGDDCLTWPFGKNSGYGIIWHDGRTHIVSRLVCEEWRGPPPTPRHEAAHSCGKGHLVCVTKGHLSWKTPVENQADKIIHGTHNRGERSGCAKLTASDVQEIRSLSGLSKADIARQFGVSQSRVSLIINRKAWGWLE